MEPLYGIVEPIPWYSRAMRVKLDGWQCEYADCGHKWAAKSWDAPEKCSGCKRRGWHTKSAAVPELTQQLEASLAVTPELPAKPDIAKLRAICAGKIPKSSSESAAPPEAIVCGFRAFNDTDGEHYTCGLPKHSAKAKHGDWMLSA